MRQSGVTGSPIRRIALPAAVAVAMFVALMAWAVSSPVGSSPDEEYHLVSAWCGLGERPGLCEEAGSADQRRVPEALVVAPCFAYHPDRNGSCPLPMGTLVTTDRGNFSGQYPPVFYAAMSLMAGSDVVASVIAMRLVNAGLFVALLGALVAALPRRLRPHALWPVAVVIVPLGMFIVPSINPSSWAVTSACGVWLAVYGFLDQPGRRRIPLAALAIVFTVVGAGARADAAVYAGIAVTVAVLLRWRIVRADPRLIAVPAAALVLAVALLATSSQAGSLGYGDAGTSLAVLVFGNLALLPGLWAGALGATGLGWLDTAMPGTVWVLVLFAFSALLFLGLRRTSRPKGAALAIVAGALIVFPMYYLITETALVGTVVQPRYIYPLLVILLGVALLDVTEAGLGLTRLQLILVTACIAVAQLVALHTNLRRYVTGDDVHSPDLDGGAEWWWDGAQVGPTAVWVIGAVAFTAVLAVLAARARTAPSVERA